MTLASSAVDQIQQSTSLESVHDELIQYLHGDTTCYQDSEDAEDVIALQAEHWDPLHVWMAKVSTLTPHDRNVRWVV